MKKLITIILTGVMLVACFSGCSKAEETTAEAETTIAAPTTTTVPSTVPVVTIPDITETETEEVEVLPEGMMRSYLTGEIIPIEIGTRRPVAYQIDNEKLAMPQSGVASAEVVYEVPIEANEVRLTAIFQDWRDIKRIGPLRSARRYHPAIAYEFDAIFFHNGHSDMALDYLNDEHCDHLEGIENSGWPAIVKYDDHRNGHNDFSTPEKTDKRIEQLGFRREVRVDYDYKWRFAKESAPTLLEEGKTAKKVTIGYTQNHPWFEYNEEDGLYYRYERGSAHVDQDSGKQVAVKNIIVQYCDYNLEWDKNTKNIWTESANRGVFITNGKAIDIYWDKGYEYWATTYLYDGDGNEIRLNPGRTWYCIVLPSMTGEIEVE